MSPAFPSPLVVFDGSNILDWLVDIENFFAIGCFREEDKLDIVILFVEDSVKKWFEWVSRRGGFRSWLDFKQQLVVHFAASGMKVDESGTKVEETVISAEKVPPSGDTFVTRQYTKETSEAVGMEHSVPKSVDKPMQMETLAPDEYSNAESENEAANKKVSAVGEIDLQKPSAALSKYNSSAEKSEENKVVELQVDCDLFTGAKKHFLLETEEGIKGDNRIATFHVPPRAKGSDSVEDVVETMSHGAYTSGEANRSYDVISIVSKQLKFAANGDEYASSGISKYGGHGLLNRNSSAKEKCKDGNPANNDVATCFAAKPETDQEIGNGADKRSAAVDERLVTSSASFPSGVEHNNGNEDRGLKSTAKPKHSVEAEGENDDDADDEDGDDASVEGADASGTESICDECSQNVNGEEEEGEHDEIDGIAESEGEAEGMESHLIEDHNGLLPFSARVLLFVKPLSKLHRILYERISSAKTYCTGSERNRRNTTDTGLFWKSYVLFTLKKLIYKVVKQLKAAVLDDMNDIFLALAIGCASVICCGSSPKQKALLTRLVNNRSGQTTLAMGDGANDVGRLQEADIRVCLSGVEGRQAVMSSDIAFARFIYLERLLLLHDNWFYRRFSQMICYFYRKITFGFTLFLYEAYTSFFPTPAYNDWLASGHNATVGFELWVYWKDKSPDVDSWLSSSDFTERFHSNKLEGKLGFVGGSIDRFEQVYVAEKKVAEKTHLAEKKNVAEKVLEGDELAGTSKEELNE